jgi:hypothetical protein
MASYRYSQLVDATKDIRLITLLPGLISEDIKITITETPLGGYQQQPCPDRLSLQQIRETLPDGWEVYETTEGRYFFNPEKGGTSWVHPDAHIERSSYELPPDELNSRSGPEYEALSYTWGTADNSEIAYVLGPSGEGFTTIQIQQNLASSLRHMRHESNPRTLWVDAVCINQENILERNIQVSRMADIYRLAYRVVVWLGPESTNSKLAMSALEYVGSKVEVFKDGARHCSPTASISQRYWYKADTELPYDRATWEAILDIFNRPWFDRLWVTQEIQLANERAIVQCGHDDISWALLRRAAATIFDNRHIPLKQLSDRASQLKRLTWYLGGETFYNLLRVVGDRLCSDPRDKVYGVLGKCTPRY